jgi:hypothetical protein
MDNACDEEYDAYNLSEFSAEDFVHIDATMRGHHDPASPPAVVVADTDADGAPRRVGTGGSGGPQVAVALEPVADEPAVVKVPSRGESGTSDPSDLHRASKADARNPFERHRLHGTLSVSDLVGPAWYVPVTFIAWHGW